MAIESSHSVFDLLRAQGLTVREDMIPTDNIRGNSTRETPTEVEEIVEEVIRPKSHDEVEPFIRERWEMYEEINTRKGAETITRSDLLNLTLNNVKGKVRTGLLSSVIEITDRDMVAHKAFEGIGLVSESVSMEEVSNTAMEYVTSQGVTDMDTILINYDKYRFVPEVFRIDLNIGVIEVGYNKVFKFKTFTDKYNLPKMSVPQPKLIVRLHSNDLFRTINKVEMNKNTVDRLTFISAFSTPIKEFETNIPFNEVKNFLDRQRDIMTTDIIEVSEEEIKGMLKSRSLGGVFND